MNGSQGQFGPLMRHGGTYGYPAHMRDAGTSSVEWAILGIVIAILIVVVLLLVDRCRHRSYHGRHGWAHHDESDEALATVRMRYSRGETTRKEYLQLLDDLGASPGGNKTPKNAAT